MRRLAAGAAALGLLALTGCTHDGTNLRPPAPGATAPALATTTAPETSDNPVIGPPDAVSTAVLSSPAFADNEAIPDDYTCASPAPVSPPLSWTGLPVATVEIAIVVTDADAGGFVHWVATGIDPAVRALGGAVPEGVQQLTNDGGTVGWYGPCPPPGDDAHRYIFTIYALGAHSSLAPTLLGRDALGTIAGASIAEATLVGTYAD